MDASPSIFLEELAVSIRRRGLVAPAIFFLELTKPLVGCMRELYGASEPLQNILFGAERTHAIRELLESSERVEQLIAILESSPKAAA
jgi:hypothetical protein